MLEIFSALFIFLFPIVSFVSMCSKKKKKKRKEFLGKQLELSPKNSLKEEEERRARRAKRLKEQETVDPDDPEAQTMANVVDVFEKKASSSPLATTSTSNRGTAGAPDANYWTPGGLNKGGGASIPAPGAPRPV